MQRSQYEIETIKSLLSEQRNVVVAEIELHNKLIDNGKLKTQAILARDIDKLEELTRWDEAILEEVAKWEDRLENVVKALAVLFRIDITEFNSSKLLDILTEEPDEISSRIPDIKAENDELQKNILTLRELNEKNTILLRRSLAIINYSLEVMVGKPPKSSVYDQKGRKKKGDKQSFFDTQV